MLAPASNTSQKTFQEPKTGHLRYNSTTLHKINTIYINVLYGLKMVRPQVKSIFHQLSPYELIDLLQLIESLIALHLMDNAVRNIL